MHHISRDPARINKLLDRFRDLWEQYPDMRFYQMVQYITPPQVPVSETFYVEDDLTLQWIELRLHASKEPKGQKP
jgi:hypothetical protein